MRRERRTKAEFKASLEAKRRILLQEGTSGLPQEQREMATRIHQEGDKNVRQRNPASLW